MRKKYKVSAEIELEINAPNKKQVNSLIEYFKTTFIGGYESFGSAGTIKQPTSRLKIFMKVDRTKVSSSKKLQIKKRISRKGIL